MILREKILIREYWELKRQGYTDNDLKHRFGDNIFKEVRIAKNKIKNTINADTVKQQRL